MVYTYIMTRLSLGSWAEQKACDYLVDKGYKIVDRNYRRKFGEIDVVAVQPNGTFVFIEVKALSGDSDLNPEDHFTFSKKQKLIKMCAAYANARPDLIREDRGWRLDLIALTNNENNVIIKQYENVLADT